jgi:hypothetical protein
MPDVKPSLPLRRLCALRVSAVKSHPHPTPKLPEDKHITPFYPANKKRISKTPISPVTKIFHFSSQSPQQLTKIP